jgi:glutaredoxin-dependent peroxiredoxin
MALGPGTQAPHSMLTRDDARTTVSLADYMGRGPVLVLFYPMAFSSTCTEEMCTVADDYSAYEGLGANVVAISVDSPYVNARFRDECGASFPFLSDFNRTAARDYDVLREEFGALDGVSERAAFVIDAAGTITFSWVGENPGVFPPLDRIREAVAAVSTSAG